MPHAETARRLARTKSERARAERLIGELYVHQIDGPLAGFLNGPRALSHIRNALALDPEDVGGAALIACCVIEHCLEQGFFHLAQHEIVELARLVTVQ